MRRSIWLWFLCSTCLLSVGCGILPARARQELPAAHAPAGPDPQFSRNAALITSLENLSRTYARRVDAARGQVCRLRVQLGRPQCPSPPMRKVPAHSETATLAAQRHEIARLRSAIAGQMQSLDALTSLQARLEAEWARRPQ